MNYKHLYHLKRMKWIPPILKHFYRYRPTRYYTKIRTPNLLEYKKWHTLHSSTEKPAEIKIFFRWASSSHIWNAIVLVAIQKASPSSIFSGSSAWSAGDWSGGGWASSPSVAFWEDSRDSLGFLLLTGTCVMADTMKPIYEIAENSNSEKVWNFLSARFEKKYSP